MYFSQFQRTPFGMLRLDPQVRRQQALAPVSLGVVVALVTRYCLRQLFAAIKLPCSACI